MNQVDPNIIRFLDPNAPLVSMASVLGHQYPLAMWRMPLDEQVNAIIDLRPSLKEESNELETLAPGFVVNPFASHHPYKLHHIKADLMMSWKKNEESRVRLNPVLSDDNLEKFLDDVEGPVNMVPFQPTPDHPDYVTSVQKAVKAIKEKEFNKVVLSRYDDVPLPVDFNVFETFNQACEEYPNAFVYLVYSPEVGTWLGATPETLISVSEKKYFQTVSLAGTQRLKPDQSLSSVPWTQKEIEEQAMVSRYIIDCLKKIRLREFEEIGPKTIRAGNLAHLKTEYHIDMEEVNMPQLASIMTDLLHPTSAVCGMPLKPALAFIRKYEQYDRELYAGFLGPVNIQHNSHLFVNLRCMKIFNNTGRFFAGAGITEDSDPESEWTETKLKMQTLKKLIFHESGPL